MEIVESFAIFAGDCRALAGVDLEAGAVRCLLHLDGGREAEVAEHGVEDLVSGFDGCHGLILGGSICGSTIVGLFVFKMVGNFCGDLGEAQFFGGGEFVGCEFPDAKCADHLMRLGREDWDGQ